MEWRAKVEIFEEIRREYEFGVGTIQGVAKKLGVHRRMVRQAIANAVPRLRKERQFEQPKIGPVKDFIETILVLDLNAPRKQRHSARRIYQRIKQEMPQHCVAESTVRHYVSMRKEQLGITGQEVFIPQRYDWGVEAQVDWYEAMVELAGQLQKVEVFSMRSMASGGAFHRAYLRATQQAFFEAHELAFQYFGGSFHICRYDNLKSAVTKILKGHTRDENTRFITFRSHWKFRAEFCNVQKGNEKGGVEQEVGYFRRNHFVPIPKAKDLAELNEQLLAACHQDQNRRLGERINCVGIDMVTEQQYLLPLITEQFELAEVSFAVVDSKARIKIRNNWYSVPLKVGKKVMVKLLPSFVELFHEGKLIARHERSYQRGCEILDLEHYLDVLERKPGAFIGSKPLEQWRKAGRWSAEFDQIWQALQDRLGIPAGNKAMIELLQLGRKYGYEKLKFSIQQSLEFGCCDVAAIRHLISSDQLIHSSVENIDIGLLAKYQRPLPPIDAYDQLLEVVK